MDRQRKILRGTPKELNDAMLFLLVVPNRLQPLHHERPLRRSDFQTLSQFIFMIPLSLFEETRCRRRRRRRSCHAVSSGCNNWRRREFQRMVLGWSGVDSWRFIGWCFLSLKASSWQNVFQACLVRSSC